MTNEQLTIRALVQALKGALQVIEESVEPQREYALWFDEDNPKKLASVKAMERARSEARAALDLAAETTEEPGE